MINVVVYCLRFKFKQRGVVPAMNRQRVELKIMRMTQRESFAELFSKLEDNTGEKKQNDLAKVSPFADSDNMTRLRVRLSKTTTKDDLKHSILFSAKHPAVVRMSRGMH